MTKKHGVSFASNSKAQASMTNSYDIFIDEVTLCRRLAWSGTGTQSYRRNPDLIQVFQRIYAEPEAHWEAYALCEKLVDVDEHFQLWRFRHMKTVERIIGYKPGTGGSSGVAFLKKVIDLTFFPELLDVRTEIGAAR